VSGMSTKDIVARRPETCEFFVELERRAEMGSRAHGYNNFCLHKDNIGESRRQIGQSIVIYQHISISKYLVRKPQQYPQIKT